MQVNLTMPALTGSPTVDYTVGGESSARQGSDYTIGVPTVSTGMVDVAVGVSRVSIPITIVDDNEREGD